MTYRTPEDVNARLTDLEGLVRVLVRNNRLSSATIGTMRVRDDNGAEQLIVGDDPARPKSDGTPQRVFTVRRQGSGSIAFTVQFLKNNDGQSDPAQTWALFDNAAHGALISDDPGGSGLATPNFGGFSFVEADSSQWVSTTDTSFHLVTYAKNTQWHPWIEAVVETVTTGGATGQVRLTADNGTGSGVVATANIAAGGINATYLAGPVPGEFSEASICFLGVEARIASGTGEIRVAVSYAAGRRSDA